MFFDWVYFTTELYMNKEAIYEKNKGTVHKRMILLFLSCLLFISADVKISINKNSYMEE